MDSGNLLRFIQNEDSQQFWKTYAPKALSMSSDDFCAALKKHIGDDLKEDVLKNLVAKLSQNGVIHLY